MIIGSRARPNNSRYFTCLIAVCVFIGYAATQVASRLSSAPKTTVTTPAKSLTHTAAPIVVHVIDGDTIGPERRSTQRPIDRLQRARNRKPGTMRGRTPEGRSRRATTS